MPSSKKTKSEHNNQARAKNQEKDGIERQPQSLNPRIVASLNDLYNDILNDPLPDKISATLDRLREEEDKLQNSKGIATEAIKGGGHEES